jgi:DNA polymerase III subunit alpha
MSMKTFNFRCGCSISIDPDLPPIHGTPSLIYEPDTVPKNCPDTWALLGNGMTKGVFQLESPLGRQWSKKLMPESIEHLAALGALLRPGVLKVKDENGISMTEHYCLRKNGLEDVTYFHPALEPILNKTYGVLVYQEQAMAIATSLAGFSLSEADDLRKAIGKKKTDVMAKVKEKFTTKAAEAGVVTPAEAGEIFGWIEKSQRYAFNLSHAVSYAIIGYYTAWLKAHFPLQFYHSFLHFAKEKQDPLLEIRQLINDARTFGIEVYPPLWSDLKVHFNNDGVSIAFGMSDVKGIGDKVIRRLRENARIVEAEIGIPIMRWKWLDYLLYFSPSCAASVSRRLIEVGAMRKFDLDRQRMLAELETFEQLTEREQGLLSRMYAKTEFKTLEEGIMKLMRNPSGFKGDKRRDKVSTVLRLLLEPPTPLVDTPDWIARTEEDCLGIPITCSKVDGVETSRANITCKEFRDGKDMGHFILAVDIQECREHRIQNGENRGKTMAFLVVSDNTGSLEDVCIFTEAWQKYGNLIYPGNTVEIKGRRDNKRNSLIIDEVWKV